MESIHTAQPPPDLEMVGNVVGDDAAGRDLLITVVLEAVAADDAAGEIFDVHVAEACADASGRFVHRYALPLDVADRLSGWVICAVAVQLTREPESTMVKVVRWQRQSPAELVAGLNALLGTLSITHRGASRAAPHLACRHLQPPWRAPR